MKRLPLSKPPLWVTTVWMLFGTQLVAERAYPESEPFALAAARAEAAIVIDGRLDEDVWAQAPEATDFMHQRGKGARHVLPLL